MKKKIAAFLLAVFTAFSLGGCDIPMPGFADYDVSGYIQALLDSSYHNAHEGFMSVVGATEQTAAEYHTTTVENAVVNFCNTYSLNPSDGQMEQLREIFSGILQQAQYTVREEKKVDTGYYIEVEVAPISNFSNCSAQLQALRSQAQQEADAANASEPEESESSEDDEGGEDWDDGWGEEDWGDDGEEDTPIATPKPSAVPQVDPSELYLTKVVEFCRQQAGTVSYGVPRTMSLDIRQTEEGELQLDMNQLEKIDETVLQFTAG